MRTSSIASLSIRRQQLYSSLRKAVQEYGDFVVTHGCNDDAVVVFASAGRGDITDTLFEITGNDEAIIEVISEHLSDDTAARIAIASAIIKSF